MCVFNQEGVWDSLTWLSKIEDGWSNRYPKQKLHSLSHQTCRFHHFHQRWGLTKKKPESLTCHLPNCPLSTFSKLSTYLALREEVAARLVWRISMKNESGRNFGTTSGASPQLAKLFFTEELAVSKIDFSSMHVGGHRIPRTSRICFINVGCWGSEEIFVPDWMLESI